MNDLEESILSRIAKARNDANATPEQWWSTIFGAALDDIARMVSPDPASISPPDTGARPEPAEITPPLPVGTTAQPDAWVVTQSATEAVH